MRPIHRSAVIGGTYYLSSVVLRYSAAEERVLHRACQNLMSVELAMERSWDGSTTAYSRYNTYEIYSPLHLSNTKRLTVIWGGEDTAREYVGFTKIVDGRRQFTVLHVRRSGTRAWIYQDVQSAISSVKISYELSKADIELAELRGVSTHWVIVNADEILYVNPHTLELLTVARKADK